MTYMTSLKAQPAVSYAESFRTFFTTKTSFLTSQKVSACHLPFVFCASNQWNVFSKHFFKPSPQHLGRFLQGKHVTSLGFLAALAGTYSAVKWYHTKKSNQLFHPIHPIHPSHSHSHSHTSEVWLSVQKSVQKSESSQDHILLSSTSDEHSQKPPKRIIAAKKKKRDSKKNKKSRKKMIPFTDFEKTEKAYNMMTIKKAIKSIRTLILDYKKYNGETLYFINNTYYQYTERFLTSQKHRHIFYAMLLGATSKELKEVGALYPSSSYSDMYLGAFITSIRKQLFDLATTGVFKKEDYRFFRDESTDFVIEHLEKTFTSILKNNPKKIISKIVDATSVSKKDSFFNEKNILNYFKHHINRKDKKHVFFSLVLKLDKSSEEDIRLRHFLTKRDIDRYQQEIISQLKNIEEYVHSEDSISQDSSQSKKGSHKNYVREEYRKLLEIYKDTVKLLPDEFMDLLKDYSQLGRGSFHLKEIHQFLQENLDSNIKKHVFLADIFYPKKDNIQNIAGIYNMLDKDVLLLSLQIYYQFLGFAKHRRMMHFDIKDLSEESFKNLLSFQNPKKVISYIQRNITFFYRYDNYIHDVEKVQKVLTQLTMEDIHSFVEAQYATDKDESWRVAMLNMASRDIDDYYAVYYSDTLKDFVYFLFKKHNIHSEVYHVVYEDYGLAQRAFQSLGTYDRVADIMIDTFLGNEISLKASLYSDVIKEFLKKELYLDTEAQPTFKSHLFYCMMGLCNISSDDLIKGYGIADPAQLDDMSAEIISGLRRIMDHYFQKDVVSDH
ncbi:MAG: hypothetical protein OXC44_05475 [Proteobacteria bacterium]|nr:hypothetical protein [Pseudomonadota bacterium]